MWSLRHAIHKPILVGPFHPRALTAAAIAQGKVPIKNLFVTSTETTKKTAPVLIGLASTLEQKFAKVGYFRPIQPGVPDYHVEIMREQLGLHVENVNQLMTWWKRFSIDTNKVEKGTTL
uniref:Uncharacterized protein n=1 Tax=Hyaloperonospora arabidopsidis (strain Emoy2) TaxID=559515 RepID=M4C5R1_HYAAE